MIATITIGREPSKDLEEATPQWIIQTIMRYREAKGTVCVKVRFDMPGLTVGLSTPGCVTGPGCPRDRFNPDELKIIDLWDQLGLNDPDFTHGQVVAFVQQVTKKLGIPA